jgi:TetR/AcrR family transcriptional regulator, cholesterol catabolism regulator
MNIAKNSVKRLGAAKPIATEYDRRREELVGAAAMVFKEKGFAATTVDDIGRRAKMDRATVYYYFRGKKELFREMVNEATSENVHMAERAANLDQAAREKLRELIEGLLQSYVKHYPYLYVYVQEDMLRLSKDGSAWGKQMIALNHRFDHAVFKIVQEGLKTGDFSSDRDPKLIAAGIIGMCNWTHRWFDPTGQVSSTELARVFSDLVLNGLLSR